MGRYGLPYMGSKNAIAEGICSSINMDNNLFHRKKYFVDGTCGGCAISDCMSQISNFEKFYMLDLDKNIINALQNAELTYGDIVPFVDRVKFKEMSQIVIEFACKKYVPEVFEKNGKKYSAREIANMWLLCMCYSFGTSIYKQYAYGSAPKEMGKSTEEWKRMLHNAIFKNDFKPYGCEPPALDWTLKPFAMFDLNKKCDWGEIKKRRFFVRNYLVQEYLLGRTKINLENGGK